MIVVADTSPLNYLVQIDCDSLLRELYGRVFVPARVIQELRHSGAPPKVALWLSHLPAWVEVRTVQAPSDEALARLDPGEREAILLAEELHADFLLIDEQEGRLAALRRGIVTTGTLGVLLAAGARGLADVEAAFRRLVSETKFRTTSNVRENFVRELRKVIEQTDR